MNISLRKFVATLLMCITIAVPGLSIGALIDRGGGLIYDTDLNITWLADANYVATSHYVYGGNTGSLPLVQAKQWVSELVYGGVTGWRLPRTMQPDPACSEKMYSEGSNCTGSELGHLFYIDLGGTAGNTLDVTNPYVSLFQNLGGNYWSETPSPYAPNGNSYYFQLTNGIQHIQMNAIYYLAWAVHDGDVGAAAIVPVPAAVWLFGSGFLVLIGAGRRKGA